MVPEVRYLYFECEGHVSLMLDEVMKERRARKSKAVINVMTAESDSKIQPPKKRGKK